MGDDAASPPPSLHRTSLPIILPKPAPSTKETSPATASSATANPSSATNTTSTDAEAPPPPSDEEHTAKNYYATQSEDYMLPVLFSMAVGSIKKDITEDERFKFLMRKGIYNRRKYKPKNEHLHNEILRRSRLLSYRATNKRVPRPNHWDKEKKEEWLIENKLDMEESIWLELQIDKKLDDDVAKTDFRTQDGNDSDASVCIVSQPLRRSNSEDSTALAEEINNTGKKTNKPHSPEETWRKEYESIQNQVNEMKKQLIHLTELRLKAIKNEGMADERYFEMYMKWTQEKDSQDVFHVRMLEGMKDRASARRNSTQEALEEVSSMIRVWKLDLSKKQEELAKLEGEKKKSENRNEKKRKLSGISNAMTTEKS